MSDQKPPSTHEMSRELSYAIAKWMKKHDEETFRRYQTMNLDDAKPSLTGAIIETLREMGALR